MGFDCGLKEMFSFIYQAELDNSSIEHEYDHVLVGQFDGEPRLNRNEAIDWRWMNIETLKSDSQKNPAIYTYWLRLLLNKF